MTYLNWEIYPRFLFGLMLTFITPFTGGYTDPRDVFAVNSLYSALGYPPLPGWVPNGGDPCLETWQGVQCVNSNITSISLNGANLLGVLGDNLDSFASIIKIDLSNNHIGGSIPSNLPITMQNFSLSSNQFIGGIPNSLASLTQLSDISLNNNFLSGAIPDAFQGLTGLINLDLSGNNLSEQLPPSMGSLSSLATLNLRNNQLSGTLDVLQDIPLQYLNIENNLFSGPIPEKLLSIPNFKKDGNPFNTTTAPSAPPSPASNIPLPSRPPTSQIPSGKQANGPSSQGESEANKFWTTTRIVWISIGGVLVFLVLILGILFFIVKRREEAGIFEKRQISGAYKGPKGGPEDIESIGRPNNQIRKVSKEAIEKPKDKREMDIGRVTAVPKKNNSEEIDTKIIGSEQNEDNDKSLRGIDMILMPPTSPVEKVIMKPFSPRNTTKGSTSTKNLNLPTSVRSFTIASLQQYTDSFSQENHIGDGMLGSVYRAELPDGKLLAVKKLNDAASISETDEWFLDLVSSISKLQHANVVEPVGYCAEHGHRLLIYEYSSNGTLYDALHSDDKLARKLSWNARIQVALGAARALEYLHEVCQPPVVHHNFKSTNILLDDKLAARVSDCGLAPLISSRSVSQLSGQLLSAYGYAAPEFESGICTCQSDVYSFGVVLLELLTGRKSYDRSRPRGEQFLVRWAIPQLHDIDALSRMVDPSLNGAYPAKSLSRFADIISLCVQSAPEFRPPMSEIVQKLLHMIQRESPVGG